MCCVATLRYDLIKPWQSKVSGTMLFGIVLNSLGDLLMSSWSFTESFVFFTRTPWILDGNLKWLRHRHSRSCSQLIHPLLLTSNLTTRQSSAAGRFRRFTSSSDK